MLTEIIILICLLDANFGAQQTPHLSLSVTSETQTRVSKSLQSFFCASNNQFDTKVLFNHQPRASSSGVKGTRPVIDRVEFLNEGDRVSASSPLLRKIF